MIRCLLTLLLALPLATSASAGSLAPSSRDALDPFVGDWKRVSAAADDSAKTAAIEEGMAGVSWTMRAIATAFLKGTLKVPGYYHFELGNDGLEMQHEGREIRPMPTDGIARKADGPRGPLQITGEVVPQGIRTRWEQDEGSGENRYTISADGQQLTVESVIHVQLDGATPIRYKARFERVSLPDVAAAQP